MALAEFALHAPFASFGGVEAYPTLVEQAAVLLQHLVKNHPLPDANKRAAFLLMARFLDANDLPWGSPDVETDACLVERAAAGDATLNDIADWIRKRTTKAGGGPSATRLELVIAPSAFATVRVTHIQPVTSPTLGETDAVTNATALVRVIGAIKILLALLPPQLNRLSSTAAVHHLTAIVASNEVRAPLATQSPPRPASPSSWHPAVHPRPRTSTRPCLSPRSCAVAVAVDLCLSLPTDDPIHLRPSGRRSPVPRYRFWGGGSDHTQPPTSCPLRWVRVV